MKNISTRKRLFSSLLAVVMALSMLAGMMPMQVFAADPTNDVLLDTTYTVSGSSAFQYWEVDFKAGEVYTITASWSEAPAVNPTYNSVKSAWKVSTVGSSTSKDAIDTIFLASIKKGDLPSNSAVKGYQGVFIPTQDASWMNLYFNYFNCIGNVFSIKVEKGNKLGTSVAAGQELVYDAYIEVGANTTYMHGYSSLAMEANVPYNVSVNWDSAPVYAQQTGDSAWEVSASTAINAESGTEILKTLNTDTDAERQSASTSFTQDSAFTFLNFFVQRFGTSDNRAHVTITKPAPVTPDNGLTISILGDSISTYTDISSGAAASTTNSTIENNAVYYTAGRFGVYQADTWWQQAADALGAKVLVNNAYSGSCVLTVQDSIPNAYDDRCVQLHDDTGTNSGEEPDIIAVYLGTNDYCRFPSTLGKAADINYETLITANGTGFDYATPTTTAEAYAIMIHKMTQRYPNAEIYCFTVLTKPDMTTELTEQIEGLNTSIKAIANEYGAYVVDLYNDSGIEDDAFFQTYVPKTDGKNILHPGPNGMDAITNCFLSAVYANSEIADIDNDTTYSVSYDLTDTAIAQGTAKVVPANKAFSCDVIATSGYYPVVQVTMGGTDITATACADGKITISEVTGDIVITATAQKLPAQPVEFDKAADVTTVTDTLYYEYAFESGKTYKVTATWANDPSFPTGQKGWSLTTGTTSADGDLVVLANTGASYGAKVAKSAAVIFTATEDASKLYLNTAGITEDNSVTVTVEPVTAESGLVVDLTVTIPAETLYTNVYTDAAFVNGTEYDYSVQWTNQPTHSANGVRAWKIQSVPDSSVDGAGDMFDGPKSANNVSLQSASGTYTATGNNTVFNLFTQKLTDENTVHITIKKPVVNLEDTSTVTTDETSKTYAYKFTAGKAYKVTATWANDPSFPTGQKGWSLTTGTTSADGDLVVLANTGASYGAKVAKSAAVIFTATVDATNLYLDATGIAADNTVTITVEPVTAEADTLVDLTVTIPAGTRYTNVYTDAAFTANTTYDYSVQWTNQPTHSADGKRAWKIQSAPNADLDGGGDMFYGPYSGSGVSPQSASGTYTATATNSVFNLFTQYLQDENTVHITLKKAENTVIEIPYDVLDEVSIVKSISIATNANGLCAVGESCTDSHPMQAFDVYDGIIFASYDGGYIITYDLATGKKLSEFLMGCGEFSHAHHCGNCMFGTAKYDPNDRFPLLYSSGDLSTKNCYVERIITDSNGIPIGSEMIQRIKFDMGDFAGANGAQAVVDPANTRILFQQRKESSIGSLTNKFVIGEYPLPAHTEGTLQTDGSLLVQYDTDDFLVDAYELPYWSAYYQGADYFENLFLQTHGLESKYANSFGSANGVMVFDYNTTGHDFTRYIPMTPVVNVKEPQGISVCDGKLYMSYSGEVHELEVVLGIPSEATSNIESASTKVDLENQLSALVAAELLSAGKDYTVREVNVTSISDGNYTADIIVKTPYTLQTVKRSGTVSGLEDTSLAIEIINTTGETAGATLAAPTDGWEEGTNTFAVSCDDACIVAVSNDNGTTYNRLTATVTETDGTYSFTAENVTADTKIAIIKVGDANGDGACDATDMGRIKGYSLGNVTLSALELLAADANGDGECDATDMGRIKGFTLGKASLNWISE